jgi:hypothetical protein
LAHDLSYLPEPLYRKAAQDLSEVKQMLASLIRSVKKARLPES